jgi:uncharacterized protein (TIGR02186 family)
MNRHFRTLWLPFALLIPWMAQAEEAPINFNLPLIADISNHAIEIHASFSGTELLLYGARNTAGDLIILVRGPAADVRLRRKEKIAGMWMNVESRRFSALPLYYALASTAPVDTVLSATERRHLGIGAPTVIATAAVVRVISTCRLSSSLNNAVGMSPPRPFAISAKHYSKPLSPSPTLWRGGITPQKYIWCVTA